MKLSFDSPHWLIVGITLVGTLAPQVAAAFPAVAPICGEIVQLTPLILGALGIASHSGLASSPVVAK